MSTTKTPAAEPLSSYAPPARPAPGDPSPDGQRRAMEAMLRRLRDEQERARSRSGGGMAHMTPGERESYECRESRIRALREQLMAMDVGAMDAGGPDAIA